MNVNNNGNFLLSVGERTAQGLVSGLPPCVWGGVTIVLLKIFNIENQISAMTIQNCLSLLIFPTFGASVGTVMGIYRGIREYPGAATNIARTATYVAIGYARRFFNFQDG